MNDKTLKNVIPAQFSVENKILPLESSLPIYHQPDLMFYDSR